MFKIQFKDKDAIVRDDDGATHHLGEIVIGNWHETLWCCIDFWKREQYEQQWQETIEKLGQHAASACFVVSVNERSIEAWPIWRLDTEFRIQNKYYGYDELRGHADPRDLYKVVGTYRNVSEDGDKIQDWALPLNTFD